MVDGIVVHYSNFHLYVVSAFRRTTHGPAKAGHYVLIESALKLDVQSQLDQPAALDAAYPSVGRSELRDAAEDCGGVGEVIQIHSWFDGPPAHLPGLPHADIEGFDGRQTGGPARLDGQNLRALREGDGIVPDRDGR